jgi:hypothetical protein
MVTTITVIIIMGIMDITTIIEGVMEESGSRWG